MSYDNHHLSIFWPDMAGNTFNLYNKVEWWDHVSHFHGPGALAAVLIGAFGLNAIAASGLSAMLHVALDIQDFYGDMLLHTHNVMDPGLDQRPAHWLARRDRLHDRLHAHDFLKHRKPPRKEARGR